MRFIVWPSDSHIKSHCVQPELADAIENDLFDRYKVLPDRTKSRDLKPGEWTYDDGGMMCMDWPWMVVPIFDDAIEVNAHHMETFLDRLQRSGMRQFGGHPYYKLHGRWQCLVVTPEARDQLIIDCEKLVLIAEKHMDKWQKGLEKK